MHIPLWTDSVQIGKRFCHNYLFAKICEQEQERNISSIPFICRHGGDKRQPEIPLRSQASCDREMFRDLLLRKLHKNVLMFDFVLVSVLQFTHRMAPRVCTYCQPSCHVTYLLCNVVCICVSTAHRVFFKPDAS